VSKLITILVLISFGAISFDVCAAQDDPAPPVKHHLRSEKITKPVRNQEWYLKQIKESEQFKAIALESDDAKSSMVDHLVQQATLPNYPIVENNTVTEGVTKTDPSKFTFMFVPPFLNHKLMDLQNRPDMYPTFTMSWHE